MVMNRETFWVSLQTGPLEFRQRKYFLFDCLVHLAANLISLICLADSSGKHNEQTFALRL